MASKKITFAYVLFLLVLAGTVLETGARMRHQKSYLMGGMQKSRLYHHILPPHAQGRMRSEGEFDSTYVTNNRGMRGPEDYSYEKPAETFRVAVMGDSFTFGVGVGPEETFSAVLQRLLDASGGGRYQVLNFGMASFSPVLELLYLKHEVVRYKPDLLILALDTGDLLDDYYQERSLLYGPDGEPAACDPFVKDGKPDLWAYAKERSVFLSALDEKFLNSLRKMKKIGFARYFENKKKHLRNKTVLLTDPDLDNVEFDRFILTREGKNREIVSRHWARTAKYLAKIKKVCDENSIRLLLTAYPCGQDVGPDQWTQGREYWGFERGRLYDPSFGFSLVEDFARQENIEYVSLLGMMRAHSDLKLYYDNDGHWTPAGQRLAGLALFASDAFGRLTAR